jgi:ubiquinone biosynthesis protein
MEYIHGTRLSQTERLIELGFNTGEIARQMVRAILHQILIEGFFHGDPHPGNILVLPGQVIGFLDFGMVGRLTPQMKYPFTSLIIGMLRKDTDEMISALLDMGLITSEINISQLHKDVDILKDKYLDVPLSEISLGQAINELFSVAFKHRIMIPSDLTLLGKSLLTLEGTVEKLAPDLSIIEIARPFGYKLIKDRSKISTRTRTALEKTAEYLEFLLELPKLLKEMIQKAINGNIAVELRIAEFDLLLKRMDRISNRLSFSIVLLSFNILMAGLIIASALGEQWFVGHFSAVDLGFILAVPMFVWLLSAILRSGRF